ncbi:protein GVQW3-like [Photinus pyralis]|uniref:protein GVQW3-like n=1 Tax=Photinus pyralis TaxID=7054 RepID=UPI0012677A7B|nr:protein GVQW3-like [Photinus pyralis]
MADCREQLAAVKLCFLLGKSAAETIVMLKTAYGDAALSKTRVYKWFSRFKNGEMTIGDQPRSGSRNKAAMESVEDRGVVHAELTPPGQTVNQKFYLEALKRLRESIRKKRADLWDT